MSKVVPREAYAMMAVISGLVLTARHLNTSGCFGGSDDRSNAMAAAHQQAAFADLGMGVSGFNLGLCSSGLWGSVTDSIWRDSRS